MSSPSRALLLQRRMRLQTPASGFDVHRTHRPRCKRRCEAGAQRPLGLWWIVADVARHRSLCSSPAHHRRLSSTISPNMMPLRCGARCCATRVSRRHVASRQTTSTRRPAAMRPPWTACSPSGAVDLGASSRARAQRQPRSRLRRLNARVRHGGRPSPRRVDAGARPLRRRHEGARCCDGARRIGREGDERRDVREAPLGSRESSDPLRIVTSGRWVVISEHDNLRIFSYPVSDEHLDTDPATPPAGSSRSTRRLPTSAAFASSTCSAPRHGRFGELADKIELAKSTTHHHLRALRQAGLVRVIVGDDDKRFELRQGAVPEAWNLLAAYLGTADNPPFPAPRKDMT